MDIFNQIAERKITEAMLRGEFDNLKLKGCKLDLRDDPHVPAELKMGYKILRNAGIVPEELALGAEIRTLKGLIDSCSAAEDQPEMARKLRSKILQLNILLERRGRSCALQEYETRLTKIDPGDTVG